MIAIQKIVITAVLFQFCLSPFAAAEDSRFCFYLDKMKIQDEIIPVVFIRVGTSDKTSSISLDKNGLFQGDKRLCSWSLNGGSGTKEKFVLDGNIAVPILDLSCEAPFSHHYTGVGFGDWYLSLCGIVSSKNLYIRYDKEDYYVPMESLKQWTKFTSGEFPIKGDQGD